MELTPRYLLSYIQSNERCVFNENTSLENWQGSQPVIAEKNLRNLGYFNLKKVPKFVNFPDEKGRFRCLL